MTTLQEYLDQKYPTKEEKEEVRGIDIEEIYKERAEKGLYKRLEGGELDLRKYKEIRKIRINNFELISGRVGGNFPTPLIKLELGQCKELEKIEIVGHRISALNLINCPNLETLKCGENEINSLNLTNCSNLIEIELGNNHLTSIDFLKVIPNPEKLKVLEIYDNNIQPTTLDFLRPFVNLRDCKLGLNSENKDYPGRIEENFYNRFYGSLEPIKNLTKLEEFCIAGTDIEEGIEYIPGLIAKFSHEKSKNLKLGSSSHIMTHHEVLRNFIRNIQKKSKKNENNSWEVMELNLIDCQVLRPGAKVKKIKDQLQPFDYDILAWQLANPEKMLITRSELFTNPESKEKWIIALKNKLEQSKQELSETDREKIAHIARLESKILELEKIKATISQQTQTEFTTQDKSVQTDLTAEQMENQEKIKSNNQIQLIQNKKTKLSELINQLNQKLGTHLERVLELYLETYISMLKQKKENDNYFQGQLVALEKVLTEKLDKEELKKVAQLQKEVLELEKYKIRIEINPHKIN